MNIIDPHRAYNSLNDSLELHLPFEETSGTTCFDVSGNGYNGVITGATINQPGKIGRAYSYDQTSDFVRITDAGLMNNLEAINIFTISFWAADNSFSNFDCAVSFGEDNDNDAVGLYPYNNSGGGGFTVWYDGDSIITGAGSHLADGSYNHFVYRQNGSTNHEVFVNGVSEGTATDNKTTNTLCESFEVGRYVGNGEYYGGQIDDVRVYLRALSDDEIVNLSLM